MSARSTERSLELLHPQTKEKVILAMKEIKEKLGDSVFITETWRSSQRQRYLRSLGLSKVYRSKHQDGLAVDIAFKDDTRTKQIERELYPKDYTKRREVADIFKKYGMDRGYDLWKWDKPHFQDNGKKLVSRKGKEIEDKDIVRSLHALIRVAYTQCSNKKTKKLLAKVSKSMRESGLSLY